jgi:uncharacterized protein
VTTAGWGDGPVSVVHVPTTALVDAADGASRSVVLEATGAGEVGLWEIDRGTATDVESDEVFVVVSGRATIATGPGPGVAVGPGDVVRLQAGTVTTWTVSERLRKVYLSW